MLPYQAGATDRQQAYQTQLIPGFLTVYRIEMQREFWSSKDCPPEPQEAADRCRHVWMVKQMNLDIDVRHLMDLVDQGMDIVQSFQPPTPAGHVGVLPDSSSLPRSGLASDGDASLLRPAQPAVNAELLQRNSTAAQQEQHQHRWNLGGEASESQSPPSGSVTITAAGHDAVHGSRAVRPEGASQAQIAEAQGQKQSRLENEAEAVLVAKPGKGSSSAMHGPRVRSMLQPTADGRMSTRPLAHVPAGVTRLPAASLQEHRPRLIRKQRS